MIKNKEDNIVHLNNISSSSINNHHYNDVLEFEEGQELLNHDINTKWRTKLLIPVSVFFLLFSFFVMFLVFYFGTVFPEYDVYEITKSKETPVLIENKTGSNSIYHKSALVLKDKEHINPIENNNYTFKGEYEKKINEVCSTFRVETFKTETFKNKQRFIYYYDISEKALEVARRLFIEFDSINRDSIYKVRTNMQRTGADIYIKSDNENIIVSIRSVKNITNNKKQNIPGKKSIVFIIDDLGYSKNYRDLLNIGIPFTFAIIPHLRYSKTAAHEISLFPQHSIIIHAPLQTYANEKHRDNNIIYVDDDSMEIREKINSYLINVPFAVGLNNHMGSYATADMDFMDRFMREYSKTGLIFIDSITIQNSKAYKTAKKYGIKSFYRDVFLDNKDNLNYITNIFDSTIKYSNEKESLIIIGHITKHNTITFFKNLTNDKSNIDRLFVNISELK